MSCTRYKCTEIYHTHDFHIIIMVDQCNPTPHLTVLSWLLWLDNDSSSQYNHGRQNNLLTHYNYQTGLHVL